MTKRIINRLKSLFQDIRHPGKFSWKKFKIWGLRIVLGFVLLILLMFAWYAKDLPTPGKIKHRQAAAATQIFDRNGNELYTIHGDTKRIMISSSDVPEVIKEATITAEDRNFYKHHGVNTRSIARALLYNLTHKNSIQG